MLLVVEDDVLVRTTLAEGLLEEGFDVIEADDAAAALNLLSWRSDIAVMLTDINLPGGPDGFELAQAARALRPDLPIIYISGRYAESDPHRSVEGSHFLAKPFLPTAASDTVRAVMNRN